MSDQSVTGLADYLRDIAEQTRTGVLRMNVAGHFRMAFFEDGDLVYLVSDVPEENLAAFFSRAGRIESAVDRLTLFQLEKEVSRKQSLVSLVVDRGVRDADTVRDWLVDYAVEVFARAFDAREQPPKLGEGVRAPHPLPYRLPALSLIVEASHAMRDDATIHAAVGPLTRHTRPTDVYSDRIPELPLSFFDGLVAAQVFEQIALQDLVVLSGIAESEAIRSILTLRLAGVIEPFFEARSISDSARLRLPQSVVDAGFVIDPAGVAAALGLTEAPPVESVRDAAITMEDFHSPHPVVSPARGHSAPLQYPPPRPRGDTSRLRLLASAYVQMGESEAAAGNYAAAVQCFESALSQKPNDLDTLVAYAGVLGKRPGGFAGAEKILNQAIDANPKSARPLVALAKLYHQAGRLEDAEDMLLEARRLEPNSSEIRVAFEQLKRGGGLLSKFGFRSEQRPQPTRSEPERYAPSPAPRRRPPMPLPGPGALAGRGNLCRHCGRAVKSDARVCMNCGATQ